MSNEYREPTRFALIGLWPKSRATEADRVTLADVAEDDSIEDAVERKLDAIDRSDVVDMSLVNDKEQVSAGYLVPKELAKPYADKIGQIVLLKDFRLVPKIDKMTGMPKTAPNGKSYVGLEGLETGMGVKIGAQCFVQEPRLVIVDM
jgi:hypothetical protein